MNVREVVKNTISEKMEAQLILEYTFVYQEPLHTLNYLLEEAIAGRTTESWPSVSTCPSSFSSLERLNASCAIPELRAGRENFWPERQVPLKAIGSKAFPGKVGRRFPAKELMPSRREPTSP